MSSSLAPASPASPRPCAPANKARKFLLIDKSNGELGDGNVLMASGSLRAGGKSPRTNPRELYDFVMSEGVGYPDLGSSVVGNLQPRRRLVDQQRRQSG